MNFDKNETATLLAALRFYQANFNDADEMREEMSWHFEEVEPLDHEEIDDLCERINSNQSKPRENHGSVHS